MIVFVYQPVKVEGTSMMPGLSDQERIFINKFIYRWEPIGAAISSSSTILTIRPRATSSGSSALPATRWRSATGWVYVNGELLFEPYVLDDYRDERSYGPVIVPQDSYFVLGDHRNFSNDSRDFGPVQREYIYGKAVFAYWPAERVGKLR